MICYFCDSVGFPPQFSLVAAGPWQPGWAGMFEMTSLTHVAADAGSWLGSLVPLHVSSHSPVEVRLTFLHGGLREAVQESGSWNSVISAISYWSKQLTSSAQIQGQETREPFDRIQSHFANGFPPEGLFSQSLQTIHHTSL